MRRCSSLLCTLLFMASVSNWAQQPALPYGPSLSLSEARSVLTAARTEAEEHGWKMAIAIVDASGHLVVFERMDDTQFASVDVARQKAWSAAAFRRPTKVFEDTIRGGDGGIRLLALTGVVPIEGGVPLVAAGRIVGAIGVSGGTSEQDGRVAHAGAAELIGKIGRP